MHKMRLAEADAAIDEQRVVGTSGIARNLNRGRLRELIALSLDETVKSKTGIDRAAEHRGCKPAGSGRGAVGRGMAAVDCDHRGRDTAPCAHVEHHLRGWILGEGPNELLDPRQRVLAQPLNDIAIGRQELALSVSLDRLKGPHPCIELLLREFALEHSQTAVP